MKLAKKARIRAKQIQRSKAEFEQMPEIKKDWVFERTYQSVRKRYAKKGLIF